MNLKKRGFVSQDNPDHVAARDSKNPKRATNHFQNPSDYVSQD